MLEPANDEVEFLDKKLTYDEFLRAMDMINEEITIEQIDMSFPMIRFSCDQEGVDGA